MDVCTAPPDLSLRIKLVPQVAVRSAQKTINIPTGILCAVSRALDDQLLPVAARLRNGSTASTVVNAPKTAALVSWIQQKANNASNVSLNTISWTPQTFVCQNAELGIKPFPTNVSGAPGSYLKRSSQLTTTIEQVSGSIQEPSNRERPSLKRAYLSQPSMISSTRCQRS
jgi:hypothetical protein